MSIGERGLLAQYLVSRALVESASLLDAAPIVLRTICETLGWEVGLIWKVDSAADVLRFVDLWRVPTVRFDKFEAASRGRSFQRGVGLPGRVWATGKPAQIIDVVHDPNFPRAAMAAECGLHAAFAFPICLGDRVLGVFEFFAREPKPPEDALLTLMEGIGSHIGQFDERRRAEAAFAQKAAQLQSAHERLARQHEELIQVHRRLTEAHAGLQEANERLATLAITDGLTGIANHRAFQERLALLVAEAARGRTFSLVMIDLDNFKDLNDTCGHQAGDEILTAVAQSLAERVRKVDLVARYGGEEFALLIADANGETAAELADELRQRIKALVNPWRPVTASFGVCSTWDHLETAEAFIRAADEALYHAKRSGRDQVVRRSSLPA